MSILIKGVKKPKKCLGFDDKCPFLNDEDNCVLQESIDGTWDDLYANCPMVELPEKHGRLIDKDRLKREMLWNFAGEKIPLYDCDNNPVDFHVKDVEATINSQPTVIEAEGEE